jgi:hypothetical protein
MPDDGRGGLCGRDSLDQLSIRTPIDLTNASNRFE